jgi:hypothetical protein
MIIAWRSARGRGCALREVPAMVVTMPDDI